MGKKHRCDGSDHISSISHQYHFFNWKTIWDDKANKSLKKKRSNPNVLFVEWIMCNGFSGYAETFIDVIDSLREADKS